MIFFYLFFGNVVEQAAHILVCLNKIKPRLPPLTFHVLIRAAAILPLATIFLAFYAAAAALAGKVA